MMLAEDSDLRQERIFCSSALANWAARIAALCECWGGDSQMTKDMTAGGAEKRKHDKRPFGA